MDFRGALEEAAAAGALTQLVLSALALAGTAFVFEAHAAASSGQPRRRRPRPTRSALLSRARHLLRLVSTSPRRNRHASVPRLPAPDHLQPRIRLGRQASAPCAPVTTTRVRVAGLRPHMRESRTTHKHAAAALCYSSHRDFAARGRSPSLPFASLAPRVTRPSKLGGAHCRLELADGPPAGLLAAARAIAWASRAVAFGTTALRARRSRRPAASKDAVIEEPRPSNSQTSATQKKSLKTLLRERKRGGASAQPQPPPSTSLFYGSLKGHDGDVTSIDLLSGSRSDPGSDCVLTSCTDQARSPLRAHFPSTDTAAHRHGFKQGGRSPALGDWTALSCTGGSALRPPRR